MQLYVYTQTHKLSIMNLIHHFVKIILGHNDFNTSINNSKREIEGERESKEREIEGQTHKGA